MDGQEIQKKQSREKQIIAEGEFPGFKVGGTSHFRQGAIDAWIKQQSEQNQG